MLLLELLDGTNLADHLARRRPGFNLGCAAARRWARDLLRALAHLHDRDPILMHRDVKPENLLLTAGRPAALKLADFGLAKMVRHAPRHAAAGTQHRYRAPFRPVSGS